MRGDRRRPGAGRHGLGESIAKAKLQRLSGRQAHPLARRLVPQRHRRQGAVGLGDKTKRLVRFAERRVQPQGLQAFAPCLRDVALFQANGREIGVVFGDFGDFGIQTQGSLQFCGGTRQVALRLSDSSRISDAWAKSGFLRTLCSTFSASSYRSALNNTCAQNTHNCGRCGSTSAALRQADTWSPVMQTVTRLPGHAAPTTKTAPTSKPAADREIKDWRLGTRRRGVGPIPTNPKSPIRLLAATMAP